MSLRSRLSAVLYTDIVGSDDLKRELGLPVYRDLVIRHDGLFRDIIRSIPGAELVALPPPASPRESSIQKRGEIG